MRKVDEEMKPVICLEMVYPDLPLIKKIAKIAKLGFKYIEFWDWRDKYISKIISACLENDVRVVNFSGHRKGSLVAEETHELVLSDLKKSISVANQLDCSTLMLLTNELGEGGVVEETYEDIPQDEKYDNVRIGLEKALALTPDSITLVLEPLNTRIDHPGYYLEDMETAVSLLKEINHPRLKILCDLYHFGVMERDLKALITMYINQIGYIHIADFPGRHEPGTGSADWPALLGLLKEKGYSGYIGFEYSPLNDSEKSLKAIQTLWNRVMAA
jgi:hydroxypyruvate isomerase